MTDEHEVEEHIVEEQAVEDAPAKGRRKKAETVQMFPATLLKNYRPVAEFKIVENDVPRDPTELEAEKVPAGTVILLPLEEAKSVFTKKIAERADAIG